MRILARISDVKDNQAAADCMADQRACGIYVSQSRQQSASDAFLTAPEQCAPSVLP